MKMHNPPHPGEFIKETYLIPLKISQNEMADRLHVARSTFNRLIRGVNGISPEMACRLSVVLGRTPESWLNLQSQYELSLVKKAMNFKHLKPMKFKLQN